MELKEIKTLQSIEAVLDHYGLKPDKHDRLLCPFHPDKTPSLQIYPKTNTYCCFSSNCTAGTGDRVDFIIRIADEPWMGKSRKTPIFIEEDLSQ